MVRVKWTWFSVLSLQKSGRHNFLCLKWKIFKSKHQIQISISRSRNSRTISRNNDNENSRSHPTRKWSIWNSIFYLFEKNCYYSKVAVTLINAGKRFLLKVYFSRDIREINWRSWTIFFFAFKQLQYISRTMYLSHNLSRYYFVMVRHFLCQPIRSQVSVWTTEILAFVSQGNQSIHFYKGKFKLSFSC